MPDVVLSTSLSRLRLPRTIAVAAIAALTMTAGSGALGAGVAHAAPKSIAGFVGGPAGTSPGQFTAPRDVAVYEGTDGDPSTDKIFVVESGGATTRVSRRDAAGNFELMWGRDVDGSNQGTGAEICDVASNCRAGSVGSSKGEFDDPTGIAVDQQSGWVYVYDRDNRRIQKFDLDGNFLLMFGDGVNAGTSGDPSVCTNAGAPTDVCGPGVGGTAVGQIGPVGSNGLQVRGVAVDPVVGDVFVADPSNQRVQRFNQDGTLDAAPTFGSGADFSSNQPLHIAVDSSGIVYGSDSSPSASSQRVVRYDTAAATFVAPIDSPPLFSAGTTPTVGLEIDPDSDGVGADEEHLLVARDPASGSSLVQEYDIPANPADPISAEIADSPHLYADAPINGLGVSGGSQSVYLAAALSPPAGPGHGLFVLSAAGGPLAASAVSPPDEVTATSVSVSGTIDVNGLASYQLELAKGDGSFAPATDRRYVRGAADIPVAITVAGLDPNTPYKARILVTRQTASNTAATALSAEVTFLTDAVVPTAVTVTASSIGETVARLAGRVDPNGSETTFQFEYGTDISYGASAPSSPATVGAGQDEQVVSVDLDGLESGQTYHYRVCATNAVGTACGADRTFTTKADDGGGDPASGRAYELVSPADKLGGTGVGSWYAGPGAAGQVGVPALHGERFAVQGMLGSVLLDSSFSFGSDWAFSERADDGRGWVSHSPITRGGYGSQAYRLIGMGAVSYDLGLASWSTSGLLRMFPEMESWNDAAVNGAQLVANWEGAWEIIAPTDPSQVVRPIQDLRPMVARDGRYILFSTAHVRGLAGSSDPTLDLGDFGEPGTGDDPKAVYLDDLSGGVSDTFPGAGIRSVVSVCSGTAGIDRTLIPARTAAGKLSVQECQPAASGRSERIVSDRGAALPSESMGNEISRDGSRIFFMAPDPDVPGAGQASCDSATTDASTRCPAQIYVRQRNTDGSTVTRWISRSVVAAANGASADQDASLMGQAIFEHASADGDKVFFRTQSPLTPDDPDGAGVAPPAGGVTSGAPGGVGNDSWDLYMYDLPDGPDGDPATPDADPAGGRLVRISGGPDGVGDCNVRNDDGTTAALRFASRDGSRAYFTCAGPLNAVDSPGNGTLTGADGSPVNATSTNLYLYDDTAGDWRFIARLPRTVGGGINTCATTARGPGEALGSGNSTRDLRINRASCFRGTADGSFVTFATLGRLTVDDPDSATADIYGYSATANELARLTEPQGGAGGTYACNTEPPLVQCFGDGGIGGGFGVSTFPLISLGLVSDPADPDERVALFQSRSRLVPDDQNDVYDVYQWRNGTLSLISTGAADSLGAFYKGNDETGRNIYLVTRDRLTWQDTDAVLDVYSARIGNGVTKPEDPVLCGVLSDGACQGHSEKLGAPSLVSGGANGNSEPGARPKLSLRGPSLRARLRAARTGVLKLGVSLNRAGTVRGQARATLGGRSRVVSRGSVRLRRAGRAVLRLPLNRKARKVLAAGNRLPLKLAIRSAGAHQRTLKIQLKRADR